MAGPGDALAPLRPGEAAQAIGIKSSTLRVYAQRFAELLSDDAASGDRPGYRLYTQRDVELLRRARELLTRGYTYERAAAELRGSVAATTQGEARRERVHRSRAEASPSAGAAILEQAVQAWRALAEDRAAEIAQLRGEVRRLHELLITRRARPAVPAARSRQKV